MEIQINLITSSFKNLFLAKDATNKVFKTRKKTQEDIIYKHIYIHISVYICVLYYIHTCSCMYVYVYTEKGLASRIYNEH